MYQNATLKSDLEKALGRIERLERALGYSERLMTYYTNPNTPPSSESLEWKAQKRERAKKQEKEGKSKRGGRKGHAGASRPHDPEKTRLVPEPVDANSAAPSILHNP